MIKIHNVETGEIIEREMTADELKQQEIHLLNYQNQQAIEATKTAEKAALLAKLGITEEEAALLLGGN